MQVQLNASNASSSLLNSLDILRFVYESRSSGEEEAETESEEKQQELLQAEKLPAEHKSENGALEKNDNIKESKCTPHNCRGLEKLLLLATKTNEECKREDDGISNGFSDSKEKNCQLNTNEKDDTSIAHEVHTKKLDSKENEEVNKREIDANKEGNKVLFESNAMHDSEHLHQIYVKNNKDNYETRIALNDVALELASKAVERALVQHCLPVERYNRALWQLLHDAHAPIYSHLKRTEKVEHINDKTNSETSMDAVVVVVKNDNYNDNNHDNKKNNNSNNKWNMEKSVYVSPFANIIPLTSNKLDVVKQKETNKSENISEKQDVEHKSKADKCKSEDMYDLQNVRCSAEELCNQIAENENNAIIKSAEGNKDLHDQQIASPEAALPISQLMTWNTSERLLYRYVECCEVLHIRPLHCVKEVLRNLEEVSVFSLSSSSLINNNNNNYNMMTNNSEHSRNLREKQEQTHSSHPTSQKTTEHAHTESDDFKSAEASPLPIHIAVHSDAPLLSETTTAALLNNITNSFDGTVINRAETTRGNIETTKAEEATNNAKEVTNDVLDVNGADKDKIANKMNIMTASSPTASPSSASSTEDNHNSVDVHKHAELDTITSSTTSEQHSTSSTVQQITLNFSHCKNLCDSCAFVAILGVLETIPYLHRVSFANTNISTEELCAFVLLCEAHLPFLCSLDVSSNIRLNDTAGLALLRLTTLRPLMQTVHLHDTKISRPLIRQIRNAVKRNRQVNKHKYSSYNNV